MNNCLNVYMLCEPEFLLPLDFDPSLKKLCIRNGLNYGTCRNAISKSKSKNSPAKLRSGFFLERVTLEHMLERCYATA